MEIDFRYESEIGDFLCGETLKQIDYGILDLSHVEDYELRDVLYYYVDLLEVELRINYINNDTGIFRVHMSRNKYYYDEFGEIIEADSINELKGMVLDQSRIWYVFDEIQASKMR